MTMKIFSVSLLACLLSATAFADEPVEPAAPPAEPPAAPPAELPAAAAPAEAPAPPPAPVEAPPAPPPPVVATVTSPPPPPPRREDDYYSRQRAMGIFHNGHLAASVWSGDAPLVTDGVATGMVGTRTIGSLAFEGAWLGMPSSYGNFHGIEFAAGVRTAPWDLYMSFGTAVTLLNVGHGGPGSFRIGGSFGAGFNFAHGFAYVKGRAAMVLIPTKLDVEASWQWTPTSASTGHYDEQQRRISAWYRPSRSKTAYEVYVEVFRREDTSAMLEREFDGAGAGIGIAK